jgi:hypothetical protein
MNRHRLRYIIAIKKSPTFFRWNRREALKELKRINPELECQN